MWNVEAVLKRDRKQQRWKSRAQQLSAAPSCTKDSSWASANSRAVYHLEAEQRRRDGVKHGCSTKDLVADSLRSCESVDELAVLVQQHKPCLTGLHASCALGSLLDLLLQNPQPPPLRSTVSAIISAADQCLLKTAHKLSAVSVPAVVYRYSRLKHHNAPVLAALCSRAAQVLPELEPQQLARLTWALGRQQVLAAQHTAAASASAATAASDQSGSLAASSSRGPTAAGAARQGAVRNAMPAGAGGSSSGPYMHPPRLDSAGSGRFNPKPPSASSSHLQVAGQHLSEPHVQHQGHGQKASGSGSYTLKLLPKLLGSISEWLPSMDPQSLANTADGLEALGTAVVECIDEVFVLAWLEVVQDSLQATGRTVTGQKGWSQEQIEKVLSFLRQLPVMQQQAQQRGQPPEQRGQADVVAKSGWCCRGASSESDLHAATAAMLGAAKRAGFDIKQLWG